jgi:CheY-like chemotaxis protein
MKKVVLIIDDHEAMREMLSDRIESMGFDHEQAESQNAARELLRKRRFDLILLDQELPVRKGKPTNKQVGRNLLAQIREEGLNQETPIIIVTGHDGNDPMVACDFMRNGADYFLPKIMIDHLEAKIREVFSKPLAKNGKAAPSDKAKPTLKPFPGGKLEFVADGVFLGDFLLASHSSTIGRVLRELARQAASGKRRSRSGKSLAESLELDRGSPAIAEAVSPFRRQIEAEMRAAGFEADSDTIIASGKGGYELAQSIEVAADSVEKLPTETTEPTARDRMTWFIGEAEAGRKPRKSLYMRHFGISESTWKRDLKVLSTKFEVVGTGSGAFYRRKL